MNLRIPGPTPLPPDVLEAVGQQMISHRGPEFVALFKEVSDRLKVFFETDNDVFVMTSSGTGGMETAIVNTLSPGDRVLSVTCGVFGDRFLKIAKAYGADVVEMRFPLGEPADPKQVAARIEAEGPFKAVLLTQNETSTGVTNDLPALCEAIRSVANPAPLVLVDAVSGLGAIRLKTDLWGCDVVVSGSQKAWMAPPGLAFVSFSDKAWEAYATARMPRFYFDLGDAKKYLARHQTPATPAVSALYGLRVSLSHMMDEGIEAVAARHQAIGDHCRQQALALGLGLFAKEGYRSNTVTAVTLKPGMSAAQVLEDLRTRYDIVCGSTKAPGVEMIRIGHMGYVCKDDIDQVFAALGELMAS